MTKILVSYRGIPQSPGWATGDLVVRSLKAMGHDVYSYGHYYQQVKNRLPDSLDWFSVQRNEFDLHLFMECNDGDQQYTDLKGIKAKVRAYWDFDISYHPDMTCGLMKYMKFDHIFYANPNYAELFQRYAPRTTFLPYAFCPFRHVPNHINSFMERKYKFAIIGSPWPARIEIINKLQAGIDAQLVTDKFRDDYIDTLNDTQVSINYNVDMGRGLLVMRIWETLAAGACLLNNSGDGVRDFLSTSECLTYKDDDQLISMCRMLNNSPSTAKDIASNGHIKGYAFHTYRNRMLKVLEEI